MNLDSPVSRNGLIALGSWLLAGLFSGFVYYGLLRLVAFVLGYFGVKVSGI